MSKAAWIGAGIGYVSWVFALAAVVIGSGDTEALLEVALPALVVSLGLFASLVVGGELLHRRGDRPVFMRFLFGRLTFDVGLLGELLRHWFLPRLAEDPGNLDAVQTARGVVEVPMLLGWPLALVGVVLLFSVARQLLRPPPL